MYSEKEIDHSLRIFKDALLLEQTGRVLTGITMIEKNRDNRVVTIDGGAKLAFDLLGFSSLILLNYINADKEKKLALRADTYSRIVLLKELLVKKEPNIKIWEEQFKEIKNIKEEISKKCNEVLLQKSASDDTFKFYIRIYNIFEILYLFCERKIKIFKKPAKQIDIKKVN